MNEMASEDVPNRRRGRPSGKNRVPLSLDERRARNAQYERERRYETSEAIAHLAEAAGCDPSLNNAEILATVISQLQRATEQNTSNDIADLKRCNEKLIQQIEAIEQRISNWEDVQSNEGNDNVIGNKRKRRNSKVSKQSKRIKAETENSLHLETPTNDIYNI